MRSVILIVALLISNVSLTLAQGDATNPSKPEQTTISADRPTESYGTSTVPKSSFHIESGLSYSKEYTKNNWRTTLPDILIRYGLGKRVELRISSDHYLQKSSDIFNSLNISNGVSSPVYGAKFNIIHEKGAIPEVAILANVNIRKNIVGWISPEIVFSFSHSLSDNLSLGYNIAPFDAKYTLILGCAATNKLQFFAEYYGTWLQTLISDGEDPNTQFANFGILILPKSNIQIDLSAGTGLDFSIKAFTVGMGFSILLFP